MNRKFRWVLVTIAFLLAINAGLVLENIGVQRVLVFWVWLKLLVAAGHLTKEAKQEARERGPDMPMWVNETVGLGITIIFIYFGWWFTAIAYLAHILIMHAVYDPSAEKKIVI